MLPLILLFLCLVATPIIANQDACEPGFHQCAPVGASRRGVPVIGPDLARFYDELVYTVQGISDSGHSGGSNKHGVMRRQEIEGDSLCCAEAATCSLIRSFRIAFCWDRFTTSYFLPDGSYGSASNGSYTTPAGDTANLISGEYHMHDGAGGNIYDESPADKPDPSDLPIPTPWTSSGVGAAIPASQLGAQDTTVSSIIATSTASSSVLTPSVEQSTGSTLSTAPEQPSSTAGQPSSSASSISNDALTSSESRTETSSTTSVPSSSNTVTAISSVDTAAMTTNTAPGSAGMTGTPGASGTSVNTSSPIIPPITNLAAATVVYCMAAKMLVWAVTAVMMA